MSEQEKLFKYIDNTLHGYTPTSDMERSELNGAGWNVDTNKAYEDRGKYSAPSDDDFRANAKQALGE